MLWASLVLSVIAALIIGACVSSSDSPKKGAYAATILLFGSLGTCSIGVLFPALIGFLFLVSVLLWAGTARGWRPRRALVALPMSVLLAHGVAAIPAAIQLRGELEKYPVVSLEPRLTHLDKPPAGTPSSARDLQAWYDDAKKSGMWNWRRRTESLEQLHENTVHRFANTPGFGIARLLHPPLSDEEPGETPYQASPARDGSYFHPERDPGTTPAGPVVAGLRSLHFETQLNFADPLEFGYVENFRRVAGFIPHRYRSDRRPSLYLNGVGAGEEMESFHPDRIGRLELVSLLRFEQPAVYVSDQFPRMEQLGDAPTRPLNLFESRNLPHLLDGEDVRAEATPVGIRMLGSIRAVTQCLDCHAGPEGRLLGAFSYEIAPPKNRSGEDAVE